MLLSNERVGIQSREEYNKLGTLERDLEETRASEERKGNVNRVEGYVGGQPVENLREEAMYVSSIPLPTMTSISSLETIIYFHFKDQSLLNLYTKGKENKLKDLKGRLVMNFSHLDKKKRS